jgi:YHS domain-containing protein
VIRLLVIAGLVYFGYRKLKALAGPSRSPARRSADPVEDVMVKDPECGTYIPKREGVRLQSGEEEFFFCGSECRDRFLERKRAR